MIRGEMVAAVVAVLTGLPVGRRSLLLVLAASGGKVGWLVGCGSVAMR